MKKQKLLCKDCRTEIFGDENMVILKDELWQSICDHHSDALCDKCMEKRIGRNIKPDDFKPSVIYGQKMIMCNQYWLENKKKAKAPKRA